MSGPPAATGYMQQDGTAAVTPAATGVGDPQRPASLGPIQKSRRLWQKGQFLDWLAATTQGVGRKAQKHILVVGVFAFVPAAYAACEYLATVPFCPVFVECAETAFNL